MEGRREEPLIDGTSSGRPCLRHSRRAGTSLGQRSGMSPSAPAIRNLGKIRAMCVTYVSEGGFRQWAS